MTMLFVADLTIARAQVCFLTRLEHRERSRRVF
jgi:hypothetical protein